MVVMTLHMQKSLGCCFVLGLVCTVGQDCQGLYQGGMPSFACGHT